MSRESDEALLVEFAEWYGQAYAANFIPKGTIDAFLAAREPPATEQSDPHDVVCDRFALCRCGHKRDHHVDWTRNAHCNVCGCSMFVPQPDAIPAALPQATEPQEFWAVGPTFAPAGHWLCVRVYRDGTHNQYGVPRKTREEAEADGLASGLPRWHEAIPAALPTDVTVPARGK